MQDGSDPHQPGSVIDPGATQEPSQPPAPEISNLPSSEPEAAATFQPVVSTGAVAWSASEFIAHHKSPSWYVMLGIGAIVVAAAVYFLSRDKISAAMVIIVATIFGFFASRQPRTLTYLVDEKGINIGNKFYGYELFKSFSVMDEGAFSSILLMPLKRFMPSISIYYPPENEDQIISVLSNYLPHEQLSGDPLDRLMRRIRF